MKICYQIAAPDIKPALDLTTYMGDLEYSFSRLSQFGYDGVEIMVCDPLAVDIEKIKTLSNKYNLEVSMICTGEIGHQGGLTFSSLDDDIRDEAIKRTKAAIDLAQKLNTQTMIGRLRGGYTYGVPEEVCRSRSIDAIQDVVHYANKKNVIIALEPINSLVIDFINTTQEGIELVQQINSPNFTLVLDINHMYIDDKDIIQSIYDANKYITHIHICDSNRKYPGNCKLNFSEFIGALKKIGYKDYLSVEVYQRPNQDIALEKSIQYLKPLL